MDIKKLIEDIEKDLNMDISTEELEDFIKGKGLTDYEVKILGSPIGESVICLLETIRNIEDIKEISDCGDKIYRALERLIDIPLENNGIKVKVRFIKE